MEAPTAGASAPGLSGALAHLPSRRGEAMYGTVSAIVRAGLAEYVGEAHNTNQHRLALAEIIKILR